MTTKVKLTLLILVFTTLLIPTVQVQATSGACAFHNGVNVNGGPDIDGSVICNDGWRNSSVQYQYPPTPPYYPSTSSYSCTTENDYGVLSLYLTRIGGFDSASGQSRIRQCRNDINAYQQALQQYQTALENYQTQLNTINNYYAAAQEQEPTVTCPANASITNGQCYCNIGYQANSARSGCELTVSTPAPNNTVPTQNTINPAGSVRQKGTNIKTSDGTIYMITSDGKRRPYTSAGAFLSYGFNTFAEVVNGNSAEITLPIGNFIPPRDGKIICSDRGTDKNTCYLITDGKKAAFTSATVFKGLGFDFKNSSIGDVSWMDSTTNIDNTTSVHRKGVLVNNKGTILLIATSGVLGIPSKTTFESWGYSFSDVVTANNADKNLVQAGVLSSRSSGELTP